MAQHDSNLTIEEQHDHDFGEGFIWKRAKVQEAEEVATFVVDCLRSAFTMNFKLGPQDLLTSDAFAEAYKVYRHNSISNRDNLCRILRKRMESSKEGIEMEGEILAYSELGHKKEYRGPDHIDFEIICLFVKPSLKGKGIGTRMLSSLFNEMADVGRLKVDLHTVGVMTMYQSPFIRFYRKIGGTRESFHQLIWIGDRQVDGCAIYFDVDAVKALLQYNSGHPIV